MLNQLITWLFTKWNKSFVLLVGFVMVFSLFIVSSCGNNTSAEQKVIPKKYDSVNRPQPIQKIIFRDSTVDFSARYIAGMPQLNACEFSDLEKSNYWKKYSQTANKNWEKLHSDRLDSIIQWQKNYFSKQVNDSLTLFYPFSGPDFVHANYFYPNTRKFIFCALEPIIDLPDFIHLSEDNRKLFLESLESSLRDLYGKSYFITTHMQNDFKKEKANGVIPVLFVFLVRSGYELLELNHIAINEQGNQFDTLIPKKGTNWVPGISIRFRVPKDTVVKELQYFNFDISDKGLKVKTGFIPYLQNEGVYNTYIKSASYLLHYSTFNTLRTEILTHSKSIFQDDTGIPYSYFKSNDNWSTQFFGEYKRPVKDFGDYLFQKDLDSAYLKNKKILMLPFHIGYHWGDKKQSQQLFIRKK